MPRTKIAWFQDKDGRWYLSNFTKEQVEALIEELYNRIKRLEELHRGN